MAQGRDDGFTLELAGPQAEPETVDSAKFLAFAAAYLGLLEKMGSEDESPISFRGVIIEHKCIAARVNPDDLERAERLADTSSAYLAGVTPPSGLKSAVQAVKECFRRFPPGHTAKALARDWERELTVPPADAPHNFPTSIESIRAVVERVGGSEPRVRLKSVLDGDTFYADVSRTEVQQLGPFIYKQIDMHAKVTRTTTGRVAACELLDFVPVSDQDPATAIKEWFRPHAEFWNNVKDISGALGRRDRS